jgi:hypothetical protein
MSAADEVGRSVSETNNADVSESSEKIKAVPNGYSGGNISPVPTTSPSIATNMNANLAGYYNGGGSSVISGPPLLGGTGANSAAGIATNSFPQYTFNPAQVDAMSSAADARLTGAPMPEALQRNPKTNFNGYLYGHQPLSQSK